jgi:phosphoribosyl 1,2-cyclic phosphodiesterase
MNIAAIEANWSEETMSPDLHPTAARRIKRSHMSVDRAIDLLKANDISTLREIHLLHLSDGNSNAEVFQTKVERATGKMTFVA